MDGGYRRPGKPALAGSHYRHAGRAVTVRTSATRVLLVLHLLALPASALAEWERLPTTFFVHFGKVDVSGHDWNTSETALGAGVLYTPDALSPRFALSLEHWGWGLERPNTAIGGSLLAPASGEVDVSVRVFSFSLAGLRRFGSKLYAYGQAGLGYSRIEYEVSEKVLLLIPATAAKDRDTGISYLFGLGVMLIGDGLNLGLHARHFNIDSESRQFKLKQFNAGGDYLGLSLAWNF